MKRPPVLVLNLTLAALALFSLLGTLVTVTWLFGAAWMLGPRLSHATPGPDPAVLAGPTSPMAASEVPPGDPNPLAGTSKVSARWQVAKPIRHEQVAIYPILDSKPPLETGVHVLLKDALARGTVEISEMSDGGEVPRLMIHNKGDQDLLIIAGEVLQGGKQDRVVTDDVLVKPSTEPVALSVNCVEQGRWSTLGQGITGGGFAYGGRGETSLKKVLQEKESQSDTWNAVSRLNSAKRTVMAESSPSRTVLEQLEPSTGTYMASLGSSEIQKQTRATVSVLSKGLTPLPLVTGLVVAVDGHFVSAEIFGHPRLFQASQEAILESVAMDAFSRQEADTPSGTPPSPETAAAFLRQALAGKHVETEAAGNAVQRSLEATIGTAHQLLAEDGRMIHTNVYAK